MKVLMTGHQGYIGSVMAPLFRAAGHDITGLDIQYFEGCVCGASPHAFPTRRVDLRDVELAELAGFDAVVHLAALSNDPLGNVNPQITYDINHLASVRLAELARSAGVPRFLYASSCSLYGVAGDELVTEEAEFHPVTAYGESKVRRARHCEARRRPIQPDLPAQRDGVWILALPSRGYRREQPGGLRVHHGRSLHSKRRYALASARAH